MSHRVTGNAIEILLVEDNPGDVRLTMESMKDTKVRNHVTPVMDGAAAMSYLRREGAYVDAPRPDIILLDLNLPKMNGREVLAEIKADEDLRRIPVVVLTTSSSEEDIVKSYNLHANCYITKPIDLVQWSSIVRTIEEFWFTIVRLPNSQEG